MRLLAAVAAVLGGVVTASACGGPEDACATPLGTYHISLPEGVTGPVPAFVYFHGAGRSGAPVGQMPFAAALRARGYAVIAPNGRMRPGSRFGPGWFFRDGADGPRDELAFTREVIADAASHHGVDPARIVLSGFSIGGSLVWYLACRDSHLAAAYTAYAGGFWEPMPPTCDGPVHLLHTHGWRDQTVPLEGRPLRGGAIYQGDIFEGLKRWRVSNGCDLLRADAFDTHGRYWRRSYTSCAPGTALELALWPGGHVTPDAEWAALAADWVEAVLPEIKP
ncbi:dienelactone hydrolase family protein [Acuticoccus sp. 2012]|uniref:Dienelactone hydrolase family protein n=2 Tax=Acuticoccus mangrovi TaxID=2796142 RepID=A0A934MGW7_9HYPH|nr:dienelactone hydrolase family protein [Acuticoccus mangrovi]